MDSRERLSVFFCSFARCLRVDVLISTENLNHFLSADLISWHKKSKKTTE